MNQEDLATINGVTDELNYLGISKDFLLENISRNLYNTHKSFQNCFLSMTSDDPKILSVIGFSDLYPPISMKKVNISTYVSSPNMNVYKLGLYNPLLITYDSLFCFSSYFNNASVYLQQQFIANYLDRIGVFFVGEGNKVFFNTIGSIISMGFSGTVLSQDGDKILDVRYDEVNSPIDWSLYFDEATLGGNYNEFPPGKDYNLMINRFYNGTGTDFSYQFNRDVTKPVGEALNMIKNVTSNIDNITKVLEKDIGTFMDNISMFNPLDLNKLAQNMSVGVNLSYAYNTNQNEKGNPGFSYWENVKTTNYFQGNTFLLFLHAIIRHIFGFGTRRVFIGDKCIINNDPTDRTKYNDIYEVCRSLLRCAFKDGMYSQGSYRVNLSTYLLIFPQYTNYKFVFGSIKDQINEDTYKGYSADNILKLFWKTIMDTCFASQLKTVELLRGYISGATGYTYIVREKIKKELLEKQCVGSFFLTNYDTLCTFESLVKKMFFLGIGLDEEMKNHLGDFLASIVANKFYTQYNKYVVSCGYRTLRNLNTLMGKLIVGSKDFGTSPLSAFMLRISNIMEFGNNNSITFSNKLNNTQKDNYIISKLLSDKLITLKYVNKRNHVTYYPRRGKANLANFIITVNNSNVTMQTIYYRSYFKLLRLLATYKLQKDFWHCLNTTGQQLFQYLCPKAFSDKKVLEME